MTITRGELITFLAWLGFCAFAFDCPDMWFAVFAAAVFKWFGEPIAEWIADRQVSRMYKEVHRDAR